MRKHTKRKHFKVRGEGVEPSEQHVWLRHWSTRLHIFAHIATGVHVSLYIGHNDTRPPWMAIKLASSTLGSATPLPILKTNYVYSAFAHAHDMYFAPNDSNEVP